MNRITSWIARAALAVSLFAIVPVTSIASASTSGRSLSPGDHTYTFMLQGIQRSFILHVPPGPPIAMRPLILVYHGHGATAAGTIGVTDFEQESDRTGELVAFLQGVDNHWNEYSGAFGGGGINDVTYTKFVIFDIAAHIGFDHSRIVAAGFSNGALMVESLGCQLAQTISLIVPVEGQLATSMTKGCKPARSINVYEIHGTADASIPYWGGGPIGVLSAPKSVAKWASLDRCAKTPKTTTPSSGVVMTTYRLCRHSAHVALMTINGGVHRWTPGIGEIVTAAFPWKG
jgi:polyhydroxybutyrate depolymerase